MLVSSPAFNRPRKTILIVDDDQTMLKLLLFRLKKFGFRVLKAGNGHDAWSVFTNECAGSQHIEFLLLDIHVPGLNRRDLSMWVRSRSPRTKIALMTSGEFGDVEELFNDGTTDYFFPKPLKVKNICQILLAETENNMKS